MDQGWKKKKNWEGNWFERDVEGLSVEEIRHKGLSWEVKNRIIEKKRWSCEDKFTWRMPITENSGKKEAEEAGAGEEHGSPAL